MASADFVEDVELRRRDVDTTSGISDLPVLRHFIYRFTERRVRSELAERRRSLPRATSFSPGLKVPSYRGARGAAAHLDEARPPNSGRIEKILKSIIVQSISEKVRPSPRRTSAWGSNGLDEDRRTVVDVVREAVPDVLDSRSSSSDDAGSGGAATLADDVDVRSGPPGRKTRPKRGHYRKYNRQLLLDAVRAVQKGDMSVHRAGSFYGVPHSTLEYKVKERHLLRQRKTAIESTGSASARSRRRRHAGDSGRSPHFSRDPAAAPEVEAGPRLAPEPAETYLTRLQWPYSLADEDPVPSWSRLFHPEPSSLSAASSTALRLPPPPPLLPFDLGRTLPVGFGWPPPPPGILAGMFDHARPRADTARLPVIGAGAHSFSMSASDLLKSFQQKAAASGGGSDVRDMADDRLISLFPVLGNSHYGVASHSEDGGSPSQVAVG